MCVCLRAYVRAYASRGLGTEFILFCSSLTGSCFFPDSVLFQTQVWQLSCSNQSREKQVWWCQKMATCVKSERSAITTKYETGTASGQSCVHVCVPDTTIGVSLCG